MRVRTSHSKTSRGNRSNRSNRRRDLSHGAHLSRPPNHFNSTAFRSYSSRNRGNNPRDLETVVKSLRVAVCERNPENVKRIIKQMSDTDFWLGCYGEEHRINQLVGEAVSLNSKEVVDAFLDMGMDPNIRVDDPYNSEEGISILGLAAKEGYLPIVESLVKGGAKIIDKKYYGYQEAMDLAVEENRPKVVEYLLNEGADIDSFCRGKYGDGYLYKASLLHRNELGNRDIMDVLVNGGANVELALLQSRQAFLRKAKKMGIDFSSIYADKRYTENIGQNILHNYGSDLYQDYCNSVESIGHLMNYVQGVDLGRSLSSLKSFMPNNVNYAGASIDGEPIIRYNLRGLGIPDEEAIITKQDIKNITLPNYRNFLLNRLKNCSEKYGNSDIIFDDNGIVNLVPLDVAAKNGKEKVVKARLEGGCNPNEHPNTFDSPIVEAAEIGNMSIALSLAEHRKIKPSTVCKAIYSAWFKSHKTLALRLIETLEDINTKDTYGRTLLQGVVEGRNVEAVKSIVEHPKIDLNLKSDDGKTALSIAASQACAKYGVVICQRNISIIKALLKAGAEPDKDTVINVANSGSSQAFRSIMSHFSCKDGDTDFYTRLIGESWSSQEWFDILSVLYNRGADFKGYRDKKGNGILINVLDYMDTNIFIRSEIQGKQQEFYKGLKMIDFLFEKGVSPGEVFSRNRTILHAILDTISLIKVGGKILIDKFVKKDPDLINRKDEYGNTPLHLAAYREELDIVKHLVNIKADINVANDKGVTPLRVAKNRGHESICEFLEEQSAKRKPDTNLESSVSDKLPSSHPKER